MEILKQVECKNPQLWSSRPNAEHYGFRRVNYTLVQDKVQDDKEYNDYYLGAYSMQGS